VPKDKAEALFGPNYPKLRELKKKYDPQNVFNKWFAITPAA
jgi:FAD/FMN-containing dehydrogenase